MIAFVIIWILQVLVRSFWGFSLIIDIIKVLVFVMGVSFFVVVRLISSILENAERFCSVQGMEVCIRVILILFTEHFKVLFLLNRYSCNILLIIKGFAKMV